MANDVSKIIQSEYKERKTVPEWKIIYLYKDGPFYRAYEWSAWLLITHCPEDIKVMRKSLKKMKCEYVCVGFPVNSIDKFAPTDSERFVIDEQKVKIVLPDKVLTDEWKYSKDISDNDFLTGLIKQMKDWKDKIPLTEIKPKDQQLRKSGATLTSIIHEVSNFPIESSTPMQCMNFIMQLKQEITSFI